MSINCELQCDFESLHNLVWLIKLLIRDNKSYDYGTSILSLMASIATTKTQSRSGDFVIVRRRNASLVRDIAGSLKET